MSDKMREEFEEWAVSEGFNVSWRSGDEYMVGGTIIVWRAWQAAQTVPDGYVMVPKNIHPLDSSGCEKVMQLLANCPSASRFDNPQDYYQYWWELLLAAAICKG